MSTDQIDFNEAPEGAIGFAIARKSSEDSIWYKKDENGNLVFAFFDEPDFWRPSKKVPEHVVWFPEPWPGEGLPSVGTAVEVDRYANPATVLYSSDQLIVVRSDFNEEYALKPEMVRPIRLP